MLKLDKQWEKWTQDHGPLFKALGIILEKGKNILIEEAENDTILLIQQL